ETLISAISKGAAGCWSLENLAPRINKQDFAPGFMVNHFIKDLGIALDEAQAMKLNLPGLLLAKSLYEDVRAMGFGKNGTQALLLALEKY
ncbi:MAG: NAD(P)-dependent oxidoreductase, partial [Gammaproteobacteria bacterium]